jgi:acetylornithine deacetylase
MICTIAEKKPALSTVVTIVFIACEENSTIPDVGVEYLLEKGHLDELKAGPMFWVDSSDSQPCIGTAAAATWTLRVDGRLFHSGLPHKGINSIELASDALAEIQKRFYVDFPPHPQEKLYNFATPSTMKPTQIKCSEGGLNQIPAWCEIRGDIRLTPFYNMAKCIEKVQTYSHELHEDVPRLHNEVVRGPCSRYKIAADTEGQHHAGQVKLTFEPNPFKGIACSLDSPGHKALLASTQQVLGKVEPFSICGSLPLVGDLQEAGYDLQVVGFGKSAVYHGNNEYCLLSDMKNAAKILSGALDLLQ